MFQFDFSESQTQRTSFAEKDTLSATQSNIDNVTIEDLAFEEVKEQPVYHNTAPKATAQGAAVESQLSFFFDFDFKKFVQQNWFIALAVTAVFYLIYSKNFAIQISMQSPKKASSLFAFAEQDNSQSKKSFHKDADTNIELALNPLPKNWFGVKEQASSVLNDKKEQVETKKAEDFANISVILANDLNRRYGLSETAIAQKQEVCQKYVRRFGKVAQSEMQKYGIPASITLAQALLESDAGGSRLARSNNNHFGIKCFSKNCQKGHCSNFSDDSHKDFFRKYNNVWESFRAHSQLLRSKRYQQLHLLGTKNYKGWAHGLQKVGYATDAQYADKLIKIIERMELWRFDA